MYEITGTTIKLTRGDTLYCRFIIEKNDEVYSPVEGDVIRFALKHRTMTPSKKEFTDRKPLIKKTVPNNTGILKLDPEDTKCLAFDEYVYDVEITFANGDVSTFIKEATFIITPEVD